MKKVAFITAVLIAAAFAHPAHALLIQGMNPDAIQQAFAGSDAMTELYSLSGTSLTNLNLSASVSGMVFVSNGSYYFTNSTGLHRLTAAGVDQRVKSGSKLSLVAKAGKLLAVSNGISTGRSFLYDATAKKSVAFSLTVHAITDASFSTSGTKLAMIAKNDAGKTKLFLSNGSAKTIHEYALPQYATSCSTVALSTDGKQVVLGCKFNIPNKTKGQQGFVTMSVNGWTLGKQHRYVANKEVLSSVWINATKFITIESAADATTTMSEHVATGGTTASSKVIGSELQLTLNSQPALGLPWELLPGSTKNSFYYSFFVGTTTDPAGYATFIGTYDTETSVDTILLNDGTYKGMAESK